MNQRIKIIQGDILEFSGGAIVNPANVGLKGGGGLCGQIFEAAGDAELTKVCDEINYCPFGDAVVTQGFKLPAQYIIHTATPIYQGHHGQETDILKSCYWESLRRAEELKLTSIAFPLLSSGIHMYPKDKAAHTAFEALREYFDDNPKSEIQVYLYGYTDEDAEIMRRIQQEGSS
ncbi:MAG: macro domain-containing protein [Candidatus Saccharimonadales bacterium]